MRSQTEATDIDPADAIEIMSEETRRIAIEFLADQSVDEPVSFERLATAVAAKKHDCASGEVTSEQRHRAYVAIYQRDATALDGFAEVDHDAESITPTTLTDDVWNAYIAFQQELTG